ncbi:nuclear transport factor 2 family protein [Streptomyces sp. NPDC053431]|uniref:nuclear transport factor 2 family protein n=1 Tax=Streptomyces sp. NPDC053431 TaxID=3365703 RepID=UPI0037D86B8D
MTIPVDRLSDPAVRAFVAALNDNDRQAFFDALTPDATMSDDGSERDLRDWTEREIFSSNGRMEVEDETDGGRGLVATYSNDTWGAMRTAWRFTVEGGKISRFETGQAPAD